jgi:hypothetical protein
MSEREDEWRDAAKADVRFRYPTKGRIQDVLREVLAERDALVARLAEVGALLELQTQVHRVCAEVRMDSPEDQALHDRHVEQARDITAAALRAAAGTPTHHNQKEGT